MSAIFGDDDGTRALVSDEPEAFPPPFRRMLAVNSDVEFTTWPAQLDLVRLFAERDLEVASSYWFFGDPDVTWNLFDLDLNPRPYTGAALKLARAGALDTLHSFGGVVNGRGTAFFGTHIEKAYALVEAHGVRTLVYTNHGTEKDTQNIGGTWCVEPDYVPHGYQQGDVPGSSRYHLARTLKHGAKFFWVDVDRAREQLRFMPRLSGQPDDLFVSQVSRDGNPILRFRRTDAGLDPTAKEFGEQLRRILAAPSGGYSIIYTHLGVVRNSEGRPLNNSAPYLTGDGMEALDELRRLSRNGEVLVTSTARLLQHALLMAARPWRIEAKGRQAHIRFEPIFSFAGVDFSLDWDRLAGFAVKTRNNGRITVAIGDSSARELSSWRVGEQQYAGFPWHPIQIGQVLEDALSASSG